jgi:hypothetical protein
MGRMRFDRTMRSVQPSALSGGQFEFAIILSSSPSGAEINARNGPHFSMQ